MPFATNGVLQHVVLAGSERSLLPGSQSAGPADPNEAITVTVHLRSRASPGDLDQAFRELGKQPLEQRRYLTHAELEAQFGAHSIDMDRVEEFAHHFNLVVLERHTNKQTLILGGRIVDFRNAFKVTLNRYHSHVGEFRGRTGPVYIPKQLEGIVVGVFGLDNRPKRRTKHHQRPLVFDATLAASAAQLPDNVLSGADFAKRYNFPGASNGTLLDGTGQTVGIVELGGGFLNSDLAAYFQQLTLPTPSVVTVSVDHGQNRPTPGNNSPDGEVMLDIEVLGAVVPGARQVVYFASNTNQGLFDAISAAILDEARQPSVVSVSWGGLEDGETQQSITAMNTLLQKAALLGVTVCVASGDHGSIDIAPSDAGFEQNRGALHVDSPACFEGVLACGGTMVTPQGEVAWNEGAGWAGGGGVSTKIPRPTYQDNANVPGVPGSGFQGRGVPDVSASATHYFVRVRGQFSMSGGTSAVAPLWAGLVARLNQAKGKRVGFLNPILYANPTAFTDITVGNNDITGNAPLLYAASKGWDPVTGLGVPDGTAILNAL